MIQIEHLGIFGVFLEGYSEGVGGIDCTLGGGAEEYAYGTFACPSRYAMVVIGGGKENERMDCDFCHVWWGRRGGVGGVIAGFVGRHVFGVF